MKTNKRLDEAYQNAPILKIGVHDKLIIFSDAHRGDNSAADEFAHNQSTFFHALSHYYANGYTFIEAGDGDELWEHKRFYYIREAHSDVYQLLSQFHEKKRLFLLYGNHNITWRSAANVRRDLFSFYDQYTDQKRPLFPGIKVYEGLRLQYTASFETSVVAGLASPTETPAVAELAAPTEASVVSRQAAPTEASVLAGLAAPTEASVLAGLAAPTEPPAAASPAISPEIIDGTKDPLQAGAYPQKSAAAAGNTQEILVIHGHQGDMMNDQFWLFSMFMFRNFWRFMHIVGFRNPASPAKNFHKQHKIERIFTKWIERTGIPVLCGHTHRPKFPSNGDVPYINSGCCIHPRGITGVEIVDGQIALIHWRVRPDADGVLSVSKNVIRGPLPLSELQILHRP